MNEGVGGNFEKTQSQTNIDTCKTESLDDKASSVNKKMNIGTGSPFKFDMGSCNGLPVRRRCGRSQRSRGRKYYVRMRQDVTSGGYCGVEVPYADPRLLESTENDPVGMVWVGNETKEVRFYGENALVILDWDDARDLTFQSGSRRVILDDLDVITLPFNSPYSQYSLYDGHDVNIRLGAPTRDLFVDGKFFDPVFGGPPMDIVVGGCSHRIQLGGPLPHICIGTTKRNDLLLGRISLVVDDCVDNLYTVYLDTKVQRFQIENVPFTLKFDERLVTVYINGVPFRTEFGGVPLFLAFHGKTHSIRFSHLPAGVVPGFVNLSNQDCLTYDTRAVEYNLNSQINNASADFYNYHYHYHYHCSSGDKRIPPGADLKLPQTTQVEYKVLLEPTQSINNSMVDVKELFKKLVEKGIVQQTGATNEIEYKQLKLDVTKPETFKLKNAAAVRELYKGNQCNSCGSRFVGNDPEFIDHLKNHENVNRNTWWCHWSEFLSSDKETPSWFERNNKFSKESDNSSLTTTSEEYFAEDVMCICDDENFEDLTDDQKMACCVNNVKETNDKSVQVEEEEEDVVIINSPQFETIDILSEEDELEPGEIAEDYDESCEDIIEIVDMKPSIETIELSDDEIEEGEIIEEEDRTDESFSLDKVKKEKPDIDVSSGHSAKYVENVFLDGNCEYRSASQVKPNKIKVNISTVLPASGREKEDTESESDECEDPVLDQRPVSVKSKISQADIKVNITKKSGKDYSVLCSIM